MAGKPEFDYDNFDLGDIDNPQSKANFMIYQYLMRLCISLKDFAVLGDQKESQRCDFLNQWNQIVDCPFVAGKIQIHPHSFNMNDKNPGWMGVCDAFRI